MEAIASEVATLRKRFRSSVAWGLSHHHAALLSWKKGFCLNPRFQLVFRTATRVLEPFFQLNHIFGSLGDWFYLNPPRRRPTVLTVAAANAPVHRSLLERVDRFVVEYPAGIEEIERLGIDRQRIRLIFPPVDLDRFRPTPPPDSPFTVLFASSPDEASWLEARGIPQLLDAAAVRPQMRFRLLWRPWGDSLPQIRNLIQQRGLSNVDLAVGRVDDMAFEYINAHATVALFTQVERCKPAPNSLIESMASGRPVVTTTKVGLANLIREAQAGVVCPSTGHYLAESLDRIEADWPVFSANARRLAEQQFAVERFLGSYQRLYQELL